MPCGQVPSSDGGPDFPFLPDKQAEPANGAQAGLHRPEPDSSQILIVPSVQKAAVFLQDVFGMVAWPLCPPTPESSPSEAGEAAHAIRLDSPRPGGPSVILLSGSQVARSMPFLSATAGNAALLTLFTPDLDAAVGRLGAAGGVLAMAPQRLEGGARVAHVASPRGAGLLVLAHDGAPAADLAAAMLAGAGTERIPDSGSSRWLSKRNSVET
eukprot:CAMPEP_0177605512 /NCGR_PEP_ID=MMETSP0419_2-20121207/16746_1 /TAXON_ID=582737 /ORGANISM="Tetraselmis sp., Strain GSL018" /LENGTH=211 /DNA_ID=CAMNT_0019099677 /DNA_START=193 /DNA_END=824 /DNA_ORIENTATION=+